jgi:hypothetical protein
MLEEYRGLAIVFAIIALALAAYFIKSLRAARPPSPPAAPSVYIQVVPKDAPHGAPEDPPHDAPRTP